MKHFSLIYWTDSLFQFWIQFGSVNEKSTFVGIQNLRWCQVSILCKYVIFTWILNLAIDIPKCSNERWPGFIFLFIMSERSNILHIMQSVRCYFGAFAFAFAAGNILSTSFNTSRQRCHRINSSLIKYLTYRVFVSSLNGHYFPVR